MLEKPSLRTIMQRISCAATFRHGVGHAYPMHTTSPVREYDAFYHCRLLPGEGAPGG